MTLHSLGLQDSMHLLGAPSQVVVDHDIIVFSPMTDFVGGLGHAFGYGRSGILSACMKALFQVARGWRQDEHAYQIVADLLSQLLGTLPVDVEQNILSGRQRSEEHTSELRSL